MMALALGPGRDVLIDGLSISSIIVGDRPPEGGLYRSVLLSLPARALRAVLQDDALCEQVLANAIGVGEVAAPAGVLARLDGGVDLGQRNRRRGVFGAA